MHQSRLLKQATGLRRILPLISQNREYSIARSQSVSSPNRQATATSTMASQDTHPTNPSAADPQPIATLAQASNGQSISSAGIDAPGDPAGPNHPQDAQPTTATGAPSTGDHNNTWLPPLPAPDTTPPSGATAGSDATTTTIEVNGARVSLADQLGPAVINADGTVSRIANWAEMGEAERRNTVRVLGKRNRLRLEALRGKE